MDFFNVWLSFDKTNIGHPVNCLSVQKEPEGILEIVSLQHFSFVAIKCQIFNNDISYINTSYAKSLCQLCQHQISS